MAERQQGKDAVLVIEVEYPAEFQDVGHDVGMGEHDALGRPGGAGGVDDGGHVLRTDSLTNLLIWGRVALPGLFPLLAQTVEAPQAVGFGFFQVHDHRDLETGNLRLNFPDLLQLFRGGQDDDLDAGVVEEALDLVRGQRRIDGNVDGAGGKDGDVRNQPFGPVFRQERNAVSRLHSQIHQSRDHALDLAADVGRGQRAIVAVALDLQGVRPALVGYGFLEEVNKCLWCHGFPRALPLVKLGTIPGGRSRAGISGDYSKPGKPSSPKAESVCRRQDSTRFQGPSERPLRGRPIGLTLSGGCVTLPRLMPPSNTGGR